MLRVHSMASRVVVLAGLVLACQYHIASAVTLPEFSGALRVALMADNGVTSSGGFVSAWADKSNGGLGNGNSVSQGTASHQPTLIANGLNGLPVIRFDGAKNGTDTLVDYLQSSSNISNMIGTSGGQSSQYTAFVVFKAAAVRRNSGLAYSDDTVFGDVGGNMSTFLKSGGPTVGAYHGGDVSIPETTGSFMLVTTRLDTSPTNNLSVSRYGFSASTTGSNFNTVPADPLRIGAGFTISPSSFPLEDSSFQGDIAELLIYNTALSASQQEQVQTYLYEKWLPEPSSAGILAFGALLATRRRKLLRTA